MRLQRILLGVYQAVGPRVLDSALGRRVFVGSYFLYKRWLEDPFAALVRRHPGLFRGGHVLDVGANVGYTAAVFSAAVDAGRQVHAFEPERLNFAMLGEVVERSRLAGRVIPVRAAVGAVEGDAVLWINRAHHADHRVLTEVLARELGEGLASAHQAVPMITLDGYARSAGLDRIAFVKIDVQGYESEVCRGMIGLVEANPGVAVAVEYAPEAMRAQGFAAATLRTWFAERGFRAHVLGHDGTLRAAGPVELDRAAGQRGYVDVVFTRTALV